MYAPWVLKAYRFYLEILDDSGGILPELPMISEFQEIAEMNRDRIARQDEERFQAELNRRRIEMERLDEETRRRGEDAEPKDTEPKDAEPDDAVPVNAGPEESKSEIAERDCDEPKKS
ncbi:hypothetical protein N7493_007835 [Penicillium malachiteum]|uniref:Uncharacterized protein n=1 Tax=Penicillium malachiteum TaxID=1324776 RepID=A0AAD6MUE4_9EURO|nr:hypothetical protein N7493_007835 [Penicillium malachiteum]